MRNTFLAWVLAFVALTHFACKKETGSIGLDSGQNNLNTIVLDTFSLYTRTVREDSIQSWNMSYQLLGALRSAEYGLNQSSLVTNFILPGANFAYPSTFNIDSVVLQLKYIPSGQYNGDLNTPMTIRVSELSEQIFPDTVYYSDRVFNTSANVFNGVVQHNINDSIELVENGKTIKYGAHLRLKLDQNMVNKFANATAANLGSNQAFQSYLQGLKLEVETSSLAAGQGNVVYLDLTNSVSGIAVYYNDTGKYLFPTRGLTAKVNLFHHDFSGSANVTSQLNSTSSFDETYIQSMAGLKTLIEVPGLTELARTGTYAVVNARFDFYFDPTQVSPGFREFNRLLLLKRNDNGKNDFVVDQLLEPDLYGGSLKVDNYYSFVISREVQDILNNSRQSGLNNNTGFFLIVPSDNPISAGRLRMDMAKGTNRGVKFVVTVVKTK